MVRHQTLRASIIEDLTTHWFKRSILLLPIPPERTAKGVAKLRAASERVIARDKDLANAHRHVEELIAVSPKKSLFDLFAEGDPLIEGTDLTGAASADTATGIHEEGDELIGDELFFRIRVPNPTLRRYPSYRLGLMLDEDEDVTFDVDTLDNLQIPTNIEAVAAAIDLMRNTDPNRMFQEAQAELDKVVANLFGMSQEDLDYITSAMMNDRFLKQLRPNFEHRGLRVQPYADHSQEDRYA